MNYDFDSIIDRRGTGSVKWDRYRGREVVPLWVADMDFRSPPEVIAALHQRVAHGIFGYTAPPRELAGAVLAALAADYSWKIDEEWLIWLPGLVTGLNLACRAVGAPGDGILSFTPVYPPFLSAPGLNDREPVRVPLVLSDGRWQIDFDRLSASLTRNTRLLLLCSPHNPVGRAWTPAELLKIAELAERHDLVICSDEIHAGLVLDDIPHIPIASLSPETSRRTITLQAPSKTFNIPGLGCSFAVIEDPVLRRSFRRAMGKTVPHVNTLGYTAALAAYRQGGPWHRELLDYLRGNRDLVEREVGSMPGLSITHVEATYLAWIDAGGIENPARFFEEAGVGLSDGAEFGLPGYVRLNFGCPRSLLTMALGRMRGAVQRATAPPS